MKSLCPTKLILIGSVCCGCSSAPLQYYTLMPPLADGGEITSVTCCNVQIRPVLIPAQADRPELVMRIGENQAILLSNATWLAPLRDEIRGAIASQIDFKLRKPRSNDGAAETARSVVFVAVTRFESEPGQYALVAANWRIQRSALPQANPSSCEATVRIPIKSGVSAIVEGYQQALVKIANRIAVDLLDTGRNATGPCTAEEAAPLG